MSAAHASAGGRRASGGGARASSALLRAGAAAALLGGTGALWGYWHDPRSFFAAWLAAFWFWLSMPLGALGLLLIWDLTGGAWEPLARVPLSAMAATAPLFIVLFVPLIAGRHELYPWLAPQSAMPLPNRWYLNGGFFFVRAGAYFLVWNGFAAWRLLRPGAREWLSGIGVLLLGYCISFAGIDWLMSTEPRWFSSIYGMIVGAGQFAAAIACALVLITALGRGESAAAAFPAARMASLAAILLAVVIFFAYTSFCQWLIIWEENLRHEVPWYLERRQGAWGAVIYGLLAAHFVVPFFALLWTPAKRQPLLVAGVCVLLLLADIVHVWWLLLPGLHRVAFSWLEPSVMLGVGGLWLLALGGALHLRGQALLPPGEPQPQAAHG
ncbi:MAG TPA: hypothetical protein VME21_08560 [Steroidobacteraceae bacterium]|nr:hypothetical protein [Steroidobacteraceae bacterium]